MSDSRLERRKLLMLARLLANTKRSPTRSKVLASVAACLPAPGAQDGAARALDACIAEGLVVQKPLRLTDAGREALRAALGVKTLPVVRDWSAARRVVLANLSLARRKGNALDGDGLAAEILRAEHGIATAGTLRAVVDQLAWRALGVDTDEPFDAGRVQRHLLRGIVPRDTRGDLPTWRRLLAVRAVRARSPATQSLRAAALSRWLQGPEQREQAPTTPRVTTTANDNAATGAPLGTLAAAVMQAASAPPVARFHDDRAFIGSIWEYMRGRPPIGDMSLAAFKEQLVAAHRAGLLRMTRADLVAAMDVDEVQRSEATYLGATFHFVALDAVGGR
jgi:hypothetical protein